MCWHYITFQLADTYQKRLIMLRSYTVDKATGSNSGLSDLLKDTLTRARIELPTPLLKDRPANHWPPVTLEMYWQAHFWSPKTQQNVTRILDLLFFICGKRGGGGEEFWQVIKNFIYSCQLPRIPFPSLTNENSHAKPGQPLFFHLLDHGLFARRRGFAHDGERVDVSDGAHGGRGEPRQAKERTEGTQNDDEQKVQVEAGAFDQVTLFLTDYQPGRSEEIFNRLEIAPQVLHPKHYDSR